MEFADIFSTTAEIAIALAGFGGIVAGLGYRANGQWSPDDRTRLLAMARVSLIIVFASLLPQALSYFTTPIWTTANALYLIPAAYNLADQLWINRRGVPEGYSRALALVFPVLQITIIVLLGAGALGPPSLNPEGLNILALLLMLLAASVLFLRLLATSFRQCPPAA